MVSTLKHRFQGVESHEVLLAASRLVDPREWPAEHEELASYGSDHISKVTEHFADVLDRNGCLGYPMLGIACVGNFSKIVSWVEFGERKAGFSR